MPDSPVTRDNPEFFSGQYHQGHRAAGKGRTRRSDSLHTEVRIVTIPHDRFFTKEVIQMVEAGESLFTGAEPPVPFDLNPTAGLPWI